MKKPLAIAALLTVLSGPSAAALLNLDFDYRVNFSDPSVAAIGLPQGSIFTGSALFDDSLIVGDTVTLGGAGTTFRIDFGAFTFLAIDDIFDAPVLTLANGTVAGLLFDLDTPLALPTGDYNVSFSGSDAMVTPSGNTVDFRLQAALIPEPATLPVVLAGLGIIAAVRTRRRIV